MDLTITGDVTMKSPQDPARVGYKNPPVATRFKPGTSGNPKGRPRKPPNITDELFEELAETMVFRENGEEIQVTKFRAILKTLVRAALKPDIRAVSSLIALYQRAAAGRGDLLDPEDAHDLEILNAYETRSKSTPTQLADSTEDVTMKEHSDD